MKGKIILSILAGTAVADEVKSCLVCEYGFDHTGTSLGIGDRRCWDSEPAILQTPCSGNLVGAQQFYCKTEMISDWMPNGDMHYKIRRSCARETPTPIDTCMEGNSGLFYYKDCYTHCQSDNCNGLDQSDRAQDMASIKDNEGVPIPRKCNSCSTKNGDDLDACRVGSGKIVTCPDYANAGCFNANTFPVDQMIGTPGQEQYSKGCSPFVFMNEAAGAPLTGSRCEQIVSDGSSYQSCKKTCAQDVCNVGSVQYAPSCFTCSVTIDHLGNPMGWGDVECIDNALERHIEPCGEAQDVCVAEMEIDWRPSGLQTVTVRRGCANSANLDQGPNSSKCTSTNTSFFRSKTCTRECSPAIGGDPCNKDLTELSEYFAGNNVVICRACTDTDVIVPDSDGLLHDCAENTQNTQTCPDYLTMACFSARSQNSGDSADGLTSYSVHGCSAFSQDFPVCTEFDTTGTIDPNGDIHGGDTDETHLRVCKQTCKSEECNDFVVDVPEIAQKNMCYQCQITIDNYGNMIGYGDYGCYTTDDSPTDEIYLRECNGDQEYCLIDMEIDWAASGQQTAKIFRSCSSQAPSSTPNGGVYGTTCTAGSSETAFQYKDCKQFFDANPTSALNDDTTAIEKALGGGEVTSCHVCESDSLVPNTRDNCENIPIDETKMECPPYATSGCFKSVSENVEGQKISVKVFRGCSTFSMQETGQSDNVPYCTGFRLDETQYEVCKQTCTDANNCNNKQPDVFAEPLKCFTCQETWNHINQSIGYSDTGCFLQPDEKYLHECAPFDTMCVTDMEVDWTILGSQNTIVTRRCGQGSTAESSCQEGSSLNLQYKKCTQTSRGFGSNDNLDIADYFSSWNQQDNCYTCSHNSGQGDDYYNCFADDHPHTPGEGNSRSCAKWQNAACFTADNIHSESGMLVTEVHRGCSSFEIPNTSCAHMEYLDNTDYAVCRQTCTGSACNSEKYPTDENNCECPAVLPSF